MPSRGRALPYVVAILLPLTSASAQTPATRATARKAAEMQLAQVEIRLRAAHPEGLLATARADAARRYLEMARKALTWNDEGAARSLAARAEKLLAPAASPSERDAQ